MVYEELLKDYKPYQFKPEKCDLNDFSKLDISDGQIHFFLYQQNGEKQAMNIKDTQENRLYVSWLQIHDRA